MHMCNLYIHVYMYIHVHTFAHALLNGTIHFGLLTSLFFALLCAFSTLSEDDNNIIDVILVVYVYMYTPFVLVACILQV